MARHVAALGSVASGVWNTAFDTKTMLSSDSIHPNKTGYDFMGDAWYDVIKSYLH